MKNWFSALAFVALAACQDQEQVTVPNRALDRPVDIEIVCAAVFSGEIRVGPGSNCRGQINESTPTDTRCDNERELVGFVTNSERNEIGMFRRCDPNGLVDLDPSSPGYDFIPAGDLPQALTVTMDACRAVSANTQSCDFTVVDVPEVAHHAFDGMETSKAGGALSWNLTPVRSDGTPLGARPADVVAVPGQLSSAGEGTGGDPDPGPDPGGGDPGGTDGTSGGASGGADPGFVPDAESFNVCPDGNAYSIYASFPGCHLIAEINLLTGQVLQSRQFVRQSDGTVQLIDAGTEPQCPVECPAQFEGNLPDPVIADPEGVFPTSLELTLSGVPRNVDFPDQADEELEDFGYDALFVAGPGDDRLFEIPVAGDGWELPQNTNSLQLEDPEGIHGISISPPVSIGVSGSGATTRQFVYAVTGDGSTHVVQRAFDDRDALGVECDTQIDPTQVLQGLAADCQPVDPRFPGTPPERRALALGPGIRAPGGATINDWAFIKIREDDLRTEDEDPTVDLGNSTLTTPFGGLGVVGVGVTSFGKVVLSIFGQASGESQVTQLDPLGIMDTTLRPHMLWPEYDPQSVRQAVMPRVEDVEPELESLASAPETAVLAPTLRRVDQAYAVEEDASKDQERISLSLGSPANVDRLASFLSRDESEGAFMYEKLPPRVVARDYRRWGDGAWALIWEGIIPGTNSSTGRVECDEHGQGWQGGTCVPPPASAQPQLTDEQRQRTSRIVDEGASFCDAGVLRGDTVVILGCDDDDDCGIGQSCLRDPVAGRSGICFSQAQIDERGENNLRQICAPFISDPCAEVHREYIITHAEQEELWLQAVDRRERSYLVDNPNCRPDEDDPDDDPNDDPCRGDPVDPTGLSFPQLPPQVERFDRFTCILPKDTEQPTGGCDEDLDCVTELGEGDGELYRCIEGLCRIPCDEVKEIDNEAYGDYDACRETPLPGTECFQEFVRYQVRLHNSFLVTGSPLGGFFPDRVIADPTTGECVEDPGVSSLLTSRLRLGANADRTFNHEVWGISACLSDDPSPLDPNPCRVVTARANNAGSKYHTFAFEGSEVAAVRYTNPYVSFVVDLTSLLGLAGEIPDADDQRWYNDAYCPEKGTTADCPVPLQRFTDFRRARIPDRYRETFRVESGYRPIHDGVVTGRVPLVYPVRVIPAPDDFPRVYIVDSGGRGGLSGVRGQVVRVQFGPGNDFGADESFRVR